jgi:hypothetical protein
VHGGLAVISATTGEERGSSRALRKVGLVLVRFFLSLLLVGLFGVAACGTEVHVIAVGDHPGQDLGLPPPAEFDACSTATTYENIDADRDGHVDGIRLSRGGAEVCRGTDTDKDGKLDTWEQFKDGKLERRAHDSDANGRVDQVTEWPNTARPECALTGIDKDGDGKADDGPKVDLCAAVGAPPKPLLPVVDSVPSNQKSP